MLDALAVWFHESRRPLPWRTSYDPYEVWISEVMLQQTQVETALPYYRRFIQEIPTVQALASAEEHQVFSLWSGLGYYRRAKNLMAAAKDIVEKYGGRIPDNYDHLIDLPGIGPYMAGAILSIAFNKPYPIVDGNVRRVLSRINGWSGENSKALWIAAAELAHRGEPRVVNQALMELGATLCSFKSPRCLLCPVQTYCEAFRQGIQTQIPVVKKRPATVYVHLFAVLQQKGKQYLMRCVDGMWEFPVFTDLPSGKFYKIGECRHTVTHHRLDVSVYRGSLEQTQGYEWKRAESAPISSLTRKILGTGTGPFRGQTSISTVQKLRSLPEIGREKGE